MHWGIFANEEEEKEKKAQTKPKIIWGEYEEVMDLLKWGKYFLHMFPWQPCQ